MSLVCKERTEGVIPDEVIHYEVLARLSPKCVLKFKSVCKSWYNLITNCRGFMNALQNYTLKKKPESTDLMIVSSWNRYDRIYNNNANYFYTYLDAPHFVSGIVDVVININGIGSSKTDEIIGSGNGLVCFKLGQQVSEGYMLYNPVTRVSSGLIANLFDGYQYQSPGELYGFGYDYLSDEYKIVNIKFYYNDYSFFEEGEFEGEERVEVIYYSIRSNSWKHYQIAYESVYKYGDGGEVVNNKLHWIVWRGFHVDHGVPSILTFDLHTEEIGDMSFSTPIHQFSKRYDLDLMVSTDGRLFTVVTPPPVSNLHIPESVDIWVMKRYGEAESWMRCYKIHVCEEVSLKRIKVITYRSTREGGDEVLLLNSRGFTQTHKLVWYNIDNKSIKIVDGDLRRRYTGNSWLCTPTLAPIPVAT